MPQLFEVTHEDIKQLSDSQLTDLLRRLLHLEAARYDIAAAGVDVALNIRVRDGGVDGRIEWVDGPPRTDYVPNRLTLFQCKAQDMGPTDCAKELQRKDSVELKPQIEQVLDARGSYILFTTQALSGQLIAERIKKMREAVREANKPYADTFDLHIYDANKIRDWTNRYVPASTAVCHWRGRPLLPGMEDRYYKRGLCASPQVAAWERRPGHSGRRHTRLATVLLPGKHWGAAPNTLRSPYAAL